MRQRMREQQGVTIKPQERNLLPGNSQTAVSQAKLTPSSITPQATPSTSQNVLISRPGSVVLVESMPPDIRGWSEERRDDGANRNKDKYGDEGRDQAPVQWAAAACRS